MLSSKVAEVGTEVDNVLLHLEAKEFTVEASTLITVQHLIQWTVTFILRLLTNLPEWRNGPRGTMVFILLCIYEMQIIKKKICLFTVRIATRPQAAEHVSRAFGYFSYLGLDPPLVFAYLQLHGKRRRHRFSIPHPYALTTVTRTRREYSW